MKKKQMTARERSRRDFIAGYACALGTLQAGWREDDLVRKLMAEGGYVIDDLIEAKVGEYDLRLVIEAFMSTENGRAVLTVRHKRMLARLKKRLST